MTAEQPTTRTPSAIDQIAEGWVDTIHADLVEQGLSSRVLLQIHDELVVEVAPGEWDATERIVRDRMGGAAELSVPLDVQVGRGGDWNEAAH